MKDEQPITDAGKTSKRNQMATKRDNFPNEGATAGDIKTESEISFFTKSGSSPTKGNDSSSLQRESRPPVVLDFTDSGRLINQLHDRYRLAANSQEALDDLLRETQEYAKRVLWK